ncbi:MAG: flavodoxin [Erysipelotrichaceae bacterium]|nr:flavodoxin [Erysipelotrichaceae bacterium]
MKKIKIFTLILLVILVLVGCSNNSTPADPANTDTTPENTDIVPEETPVSEDTEPRILVAYFSATGNTKGVAEKMAGILGADLYEIVPAVPYTTADLNYNDSSCRANQEQNDKSFRTEIVGSVDNMDQYDIVLIGHPVWWGEEPRIIDTFVEAYDFNGKIVSNFCTSGGSGVSNSTNNLKNMLPDSDYRDGMRFDKNAGEDDINNWLTGINIK